MYIRRTRVCACPEATASMTTALRHNECVRKDERRRDDKENWAKVQETCFATRCLHYLALFLNSNLNQNLQLLMFMSLLSKLVMSNVSSRSLKAYKMCGGTSTDGTIFCSIGLRSGELGGRFNTLNSHLSFSSNQS